MGSIPVAISHTSDNPKGSVNGTTVKYEQVEINGHHVELSDVEQHVRKGMLDGDNIEVVAEFVVPHGGDMAILVAFLHDTEATARDEDTLSERMQAMIIDLDDELAAAQVPTNMIPSAYIPVDSIPITSTGKIDRPRLRAVGEGMTLEQMDAFRTSDSHWRQPSTPMELRLQSLWSAVLGTSPEEIGADDNFLRIGGDSVKAMRLVGAAYKQGLSLAVADVFTHPRLSDLARVAVEMELQAAEGLTVEDSIIKPFSLLQTGADVQAVRNQAAALCGVDSTEIVDAFPCTPLQEGLLALTAKESGNYVARRVLELSASIEVSRFRRAWEEVVRTTPIMRTRIVDLAGQGLVQVVINQQTVWAPMDGCKSRSAYEHADKQFTMALGTPLVRFGMVDESRQSGKHFLMLTMHHATYDGWSMPLLADRLQRAYRDGAGLQHPPPFQGFVRHIMNVDKAQEARFWREQFDELEAQIFPARQSSSHQPRTDTMSTHFIQGLQWPKSDVTASTTVRAAWSMVAAGCTDSNDVVFGVTLSGRQAALAGVESMIGPTLAAVPVRVVMDRERSVEELQLQLQAQLVEMTPFEQTGLQQIRRLSPEAQRACEFQTLIIVQPSGADVDRWGGIFVEKNGAENEAGNDVRLRFYSYAITLECKLREEGLELRVGFDSLVIDGHQVGKLISQFEYFLRLMCDPGSAGKKLRDLETVSQEDLGDIWDWNATVPQAAEVCVHDLIIETARKQPDAPAVCAWDGGWTYAELDDMSNRLAHYLMTLGVGPEVVVPLCFEKSKWTAVAMVAVMKSGGASVLLDSAQPEERLRVIVQQVQPILMLASSMNQELASRLTDKLIVVLSEKHLAGLDETQGVRLPEIQPWNTLYVAFTSGSTGTPKGAIITHTNMSSAIRYQQGGHGFKATSRVYDFASYAFDIAWGNALHALSSGACLCVPSDDERRDDLSGSISRLGANIVHLTPSTASILSAEVIESLEVLVLGGEALSSEDAKRWAAKTSVRNVYGPCECTLDVTLANVSPESAYAVGSTVEIGKGLGAVLWVVRPTDHSRLAAIGNVGELLVEGPLVGGGYLADAEKTAAAFIRNPSWLLQGGPGRPGRQGRLYKTGDLVRYSADGSLEFIGRKDAQVKINGQRVELGEIESHMSRHPSTRQSASLFPDSGPCAKKLVGIFSLDSIQPGDDLQSAGIQLASKEHAARVDQHVETLRALLDDTLPSYMVPSIWIAVKDIPLNSSGKLDRKQLLAWLSNMNAETYAKISQADRSYALPREPATDSERTLRDACSLVLGMPAADINLQRSFISNGGDSISAMRLSSHCRSIGVIFSVTALLKSSALAGVVRSSAVKANPVIQRSEQFNQLFGLSPIQQWFFGLSAPEQANTEGNYSNQGFYVKVRRWVSTKDMYKAISEIVNQHSMFRARFQKVAGDWMQQVLEPDDALQLHHFGASAAESLAEIAAQTSQRHCQLDIEKGPVFAADLYTLPTGEQYLILIAHHLVFDLVSWRIILDDLQTLLTGGTVESGLPFQIWNLLQTEKAKCELDPLSVLPAGATENELDFWNFDQGTLNVFSDYHRCTVDVDQRTTSLLLKGANNAFNTESVDLLLSAVWDSFLRVFSERKGLTIFNEGHGREPWSEDIDLTRTVGWFTTISPITVSRAAGDSPANIVRVVKDVRRRLPSNGWAYFASRYLNDKGISAFQAHRSTMEVVFNYRGQFQQLEHQDSLFTNIKLDGVSPFGPTRPAPALINIITSITDGSTHFSFTWNRHIAHQDRIREWISQVGPSLQVICDDLVLKETSTTLCDYEFLSLDYQGLQELQSHVIPRVESINSSTVEDILPCSSMVDGILLAQIQEPESYIISRIYELGSSDTKPLSLERLGEAWQSVIARHPSLRTVFVDGLDTTAAFNQVVLQSYRGEVTLLESESEASALEMFKQLPTVDYRELKPPHRLDICRVSSSNRIFCQLRISHAVTDGSSAAIIQQDWTKAYAGTLNTTGLLNASRDFTRTLKMISTADKMAFWMKKLAETRPCYFPSLSTVSVSQSSVEVERVSMDISAETFAQIQRFCEQQSVTPASLFQSAWALTLAAYVGTDSICFGYLVSGRDLPIEGIAESIGAYANMLICRVDVCREWTGQQFVRHIYEQVLEDIGFQHCSLADIQHKLAVSPAQGLFNTILSFRTRGDHAAEYISNGAQDLIFISSDGKNTTEVSAKVVTQQWSKVWFTDKPATV